MSTPLALVCSVDLEAAPVRQRLRDTETVRVGRKAGTLGSLGGQRVLLLPAGMGKANAAQGLTALLEKYRVRGVLAFGVGGAYPGAGLDVGMLALATAELYGDEGVETPTGWISAREIGIPLLERPGVCRFNEFPLESGRVDAAHAALRRGGAPAAAGAFVTVSCCSGTERRGRELAARFGAICESMEGAAFAQVAALYEVPLLELRGISNRVEDRDLSRWRLREAAEAAARGVELLAAAWEGERW